MLYLVQSNLFRIIYPPVPYNSSLIRNRCSNRTIYTNILIYVVVCAKAMVDLSKDEPGWLGPGSKVEIGESELRHLVVGVVDVDAKRSLNELWIISS